MKTSIGFDVPMPKKACKDQKCPFCGVLSVKTETITGKVIKKDIHGSAVIEWEYPRLVPKYERFLKQRSRVHVHNSPCINANIGDFVVAAKTRPISKTKHYAIIKIVTRAVA